MNVPAVFIVAFRLAASAVGDSKPEKPFRCPEGMVLIPGGSFRMGGTGKLVRVQPFCIDRTEVTAAEYEVCVEAKLCSSEGLTGDEWATYLNSLRADHPVNKVSWAQADRYCRARYKRLPSEREWEWTAQGGLAGNAYPWGNDPPSNQLCWNGEGNDLGKGNRNRTCPVTAYPKDSTAQGVLGLAGNVAEWTSTRSGGDKRVIRGGHFRVKNALDSRAVFRDALEPSSRIPFVGFRCAAEPERD